ncbi:MAG TPA: FHA domain-containing protein, partial [Verrucomicrobiae bacterium]|nr:FHA domain-containing protein [Verrucomicrobiae bacterium]
MGNMLRLVVNPGTDSAWEIPLSPGVISLGRGPDNSFPIEHPSVSSTHCQVTITDAGVRVKDLGSVNGTFVDDAMVDEAPLVNGQTLRLGEVVMRLESDLIPRARPIPGASSPPSFSEQSAAPVFCKFHPKVVAQFRCPKCHRSFCDLCVSHRQGGYFCRACSVECLPLEQTQAPAVEQSFFARAGGAFGYPLKGDGWMLLICGGILFTLIDAAKFLAHFAFIYGFTALVFLTVFGVGYLMRYLECIITDTARGENEMPDWPDLADFSSAVTGPFFQMVGLVVFCFSPAILLTIYALFAREGGAWLGWATVAAFFSAR